MAESWVDHELDLSEPSREWQDEYCSRFRQWTPQVAPGNLAALKDLFVDLHRENHEEYSSYRMGARAYSKLLLIIEIFRLYLDGADQPKEVFHMFGHLIEASQTPQQEEGWRAASRNPDYHRPTLADLPIMFMIDLNRFEQFAIARRVLDFAYFAYREKLELLLQTSLDRESWRANLMEVWPYLMLRHMLPVSREKGFPPFLSLEDVVAFEEEEKQLSENFACVFAALIRVGQASLDQDLDSFEREIMQIRETKGRIEARKRIIFHHRNKLEIPTYFEKHLVKRVSA